MFRFLFRFAGLVVIAISFLFVVYDGTKSIADQTTYISRRGPTPEKIDPNSLWVFEPAVETLAGAWVWNDVVQPYFLEQPTELVRNHHWCPLSPAWEQEKMFEQLRQRAAAMGVSTAELVVDLLKEIVRDGLYDAVLDRDDLDANCAVAKQAA